MTVVPTSLLEVAGEGVHGSNECRVSPIGAQLVLAFEPISPILFPRSFEAASNTESTASTAPTACDGETSLSYE
jgi:hypothetical protein